MGLSPGDGSSVKFFSPPEPKEFFPSYRVCIKINNFIATPGLCRLGGGSLSSAGERYMASLGSVAPALGWPNHLSTYLHISLVHLDPKAFG